MEMLKFFGVLCSAVMAVVLIMIQARLLAELQECRKLLEKLVKNGASGSALPKVNGGFR